MLTQRGPFLFEAVADVLSDMAGSPQLKKHVGERFGHLRIIRYSHVNKSGTRAHGHWECRCDCKGRTIVGYPALHDGRVKTCGSSCRFRYHRQFPADHVGERFGQLVITGRSKVNQSGNVRRCFWKCLCDCGQKTIVSYMALRAGVQSCGCLRKARGQDRSLKQRRGARKRRANHVGERYGLLTITKRAPGSCHWYVRCDCGTRGKIICYNLLARRTPTRSCGCLHHRSGPEHPRYKFGTLGINRVEYRTYRSMMQRCHGKNAHLNERYGGRGITVCDEWRDKENGFLNFLAAMGKRPDGMSIDRINVEAGYSPSNCRWADKSTQANNRRCSYTEEELDQLRAQAEADRAKEQELNPF